MGHEIPEEITVKILLVDDEVNITKALKRFLAENEQYDVLIANSGDEALQIIAAEPAIGVIISDQRMPGMTGVEFLAKARALLPDAVRILLTGYADIEASIGAINQGAVFRYLTKPWNDAELLDVVAEAARGFWLVAENRRLNNLVEKQNAELQEWNVRLKQRVLEQTSQIRAKSDALAEGNLQLRDNFAQTIEALVGLIEMRDRSAPGHSRNVAELVTAMAKKMDCSEEEIDMFRSAALLHDIGKIGMPDELLKKPVSAYEPGEMKEYHNHVVRGQAAIDTVPALRKIGLLIRHHHEQFDGQGFPDRLKGDKIPLGARMIGAANIFERKLIQYPESEALDSAIRDMTTEWGKSLDPALCIPLEEGAREVYKHLDISVEVIEMKVSPKELVIGMQLRRDLYSGTGVLLLKQGTVFDESAIVAVKRCQTIDPLEREISVLIDRSQ